MLTPKSYSPKVAARLLTLSRRPIAPTQLRIPHTTSQTILRPFSGTILLRSSNDGPEPPSDMTDAELQIFEKLKSALEPTKLQVRDISGGCGSMYGLDVVSPKFAGLSVVKQHKMVNQVLADEIKQWHGIQLNTKSPS